MAIKHVVALGFYDDEFVPTLGFGSSPEVVPPQQGILRLWMQAVSLLDFRMDDQGRVLNLVAQAEPVLNLRAEIDDGT